jgi:hypothetical protein
MMNNIVTNSQNCRLKPETLKNPHLTEILNPMKTIAFLLILVLFVNQTGNTAITQYNHSAVSNYFGSISGLRFEKDSQGDPPRKNRLQLTEERAAIIDRHVPAFIETNFNYLKFDVNKYIGTESTDKMELPVENLESLKFDVNSFVESNPVSYDELPTPEFEYLKFNVNTFIETNPINSELPSAE